MCTMESAVDYDSSFGVWYSAGKWKGEFRVKWVRRSVVIWFEARVCMSVRAVSDLSFNLRATDGILLM